MGRGQELLNAAREGDQRTVEKILGQITNISGPFTSLKNILQIGKSRAVELDKKQDSKLENPEDPNGLRRGAGVNVQDDNGYTPLHQACLNGHRDIVRVLLAVGASPCIVDKKGATPLHLAAFKGDHEVCWSLLNHSNPPCNVDQLTSDHETALLIAAQFGFTTVVAQLIARGADVTIKNNNDESALDLAAQYDRLEVVKHLLQVRPHLVDQYRHPACRNVVFASTPLHRASMNGKEDVVKALIDAGMDPNVRSGPNGGTPLHEAARFGKPSVVRILLNKGADLYAQDSNRKTVYDLLAEYPKEATREVRKVIREYENIMGNFDSDKELPPFPVQDSPDAVMSCSDIPTAKMLNPKSNASPEMGHDRKGNLLAINAFNPTPSPEARIKNQVLPSKHNVNSTLSVDMRDRSESFLNKAVHNKQFKILGTAIASDTACSDLLDQQSKIISEFKSRNKSKAGPDSEKEVRTVHVAHNLVDHSDRIRRSTMETQRSTYLNDVNDLKNLRPQKPLKPTAYVSRFVDEPVEDNADAIYENIIKNNDFAAKNNKYSPKNNDYAANNNDYAAENSDYAGGNNENAGGNNDYASGNNDYAGGNNNYEKENIYENVNSKFSQDVVDTKHAATDGYVTMNSNNRFHRSATFTGTSIKPDKFSKSWKKNEDDCVNSNGYPEDYVTMSPEDYVTMNPVGQNDRSLSVQLNKTDLVHLRGDIGCIYEPTDYSYIYELHPGACHGKPFIKSKQKAKPQPCYCHEDPDREAKIQRKLNTRARPVGGSQNIYYSCEDIYVSMKNKEGIYSSLNNLGYDSQTTHKTSQPMAEGDIEIWSEKEEKLYKFDGSDFNQSNQEKASTLDAKSVGILKKKLILMKQLFVEWKTTTQKNTNNNESFLSPSSSSLTKSHPKSFVKKLASKCLGLKAKFNSAPNISNSEAEVDVKSKQSDQKSNSNTMLIGNSKFFKMLSKKEESGEIVCNDEFDTISLDRLGTLNRDSVVNRSNRSCPGFKTSLPNISENNELSDSQESIPESVVITEIDCNKIDKDLNINEAVNRSMKLNIFEPREIKDRRSVTSVVSTESTSLINECYESYEFSKFDTGGSKKISLPKPPPRATIAVNTNSNENIYENVVMEIKTIPKPAARIHIPVKPLDEVQKRTLYENIAVIQEKKLPEPVKRTIVPKKPSSDSFDEKLSRSSRSSTLSSDSMIDETNLEDILLSEKSKSFRHGKIAAFSASKSTISRTHSNSSDSSDMTDASALENVDCSYDTEEKPLYLSMTGTMPNKKADNFGKKKVLFRHKTFTNIEVDRNSVKVKDLPQWNNAFLKETLAHYHIRGTGHCIYKAPTVKEFIYIFNRDTLYSDVPPFTKVPNDKRDSYYETAICFCRPRPRKFHSSAEDLLDKSVHAEDSKVTIDIESLKKRSEMTASSFQCYCDSGSCSLHSSRRDTPVDLVVKFSAIKRSISTPDITLETSPYSTASNSNIPKNKSVPSHLEDPYAVVTLEDIIARNSHQSANKTDLDSPIYTPMSHPSTLSSSSSARPYSIKDIAEVISLNAHSTSTASTLSHASGLHLPVRKSSSSEYSGHWSLHTCNSNATIKSDASFKSCQDSSDDSDDGTLHSDEEVSDAETVKSEVSTAKRPWVHSDSFRFGSHSKSEIDVIVEENSEDKSEVSSSKHESGICLEGSESSSSECEDDSGIPRVDADMSLDCASLERVSGLVGGVRSGSGRRRWDEAEGTSEGDALSVSSAASSCAPLLLAHHHEYSKVSPTPPKKPPRRNLSVSPTHANSPSSGYSYELRPHARSQDDLDDIQGAKHYLKHGRSVDQYVDSKLSYSEYEENHNSPRVAPVPNPRPSLKHRSQPVAITAMYENIVIKEQNPRRKLRRNNFTPNENYEQRMNDNRVRKYSNQEKSSLESLLDDQSMNSPSDCERYYEGKRGSIPLSPTHYEQPPTPDHPPPSAKQAENSIHERIRPLSQLIMEVVEEIRIRKKSQGDIVNS